MGIRAKQIIDFYLGGFLLLLLYIPVRTAGILLRRQHDLKSAKQIVFVKMLGAGSIFAALPAILAIQSKNSDIKISLITTRSLRETVRVFRVFHEIICIDDSNIFTLMLTTLRAIFWAMKNADTTIDLEIHSRLTTVMTTLMMVRNRIGFVDHNSMWRRRVYTHVIYFNVFAPAYTFYDGIATLFGVEKIHRSDLTNHIEFILGPAAKTEAGLFAIGAGCSNFGKERQLSADRWIHLLQRIRQEIPASRFLFIGGKDDFEFCQPIADAIPGSQNLCGSLNFEDSLKKLRCASVFIGIDSLLAHLARVLCKTVITFWGPTLSGSRLRSMPIRELTCNATIPCSPCIHVAERPPCRGNNICMTQHNMESVLDFLLQKNACVSQTQTESATLWIMFPVYPYSMFPVTVQIE